MAREEILCQARLDIHYALYSISTLMLSSTNQISPFLLYFLFKFIIHSNDQVRKCRHPWIFFSYSPCPISLVNFCLRNWTWDSLHSHVTQTIATKAPNMVHYIQSLMPLLHPLFSHQHSPCKIKSDHIS